MTTSADAPIAGTPPTETECIVSENRSQLDPKDPSLYICGCRVHVHPGKGEKIHRHPCAEHPRLHDHVPAPLARDHSHE